MKSITTIKTHEGRDWVWPLNDGVGGEHCCWDYMLTHPDTPYIVSSYVEEKGVVVQAGGNAGFYVDQYSKLFNTVYTFEPEAVNFYCLNANVTAKNVIKFQACLGMEHQCVGLDTTLSDTGSTHVKGEGIIPTLRIDDLNLSTCHLIHLDIEGYELFALAGAIETIKKHQPVIALESHDAWAARYNTSLPQIEEFLKHLGYDKVGEARGDIIYKHRGLV